MYIPKPFDNKNLEQLHFFIEKFNFATIIGHDEGEMTVSHVPIMLDCGKGQYGTLIWHLANLNPQATLLKSNKNVLCIFHGPHAYISPHWYKTAPNVPTWNYAVVHAHGIPHAITESELEEDLLKLVAQHESIVNKNNPYVVPDDLKFQLMQHITGFRMEITRIEGKFKLGQNRAPEDQENMLQELHKSNHQGSLALAQFIEEFYVERVTSVPGRRIPG